MQPAQIIAPCVVRRRALVRETTVALLLAGASFIAACSEHGASTDPNADPAAQREDVSFAVHGVKYPLVSIGPRRHSLTVGQHATLSVMLSTPTAIWNGRHMRFSSSDPSVVKVRTTNWGATAGDTARITGVGSGNAVITATTQSGTSDTLHVSVGETGGPPPGSGSLAGCGAPNLGAWSFLGGTFGPLGTSLLGRSHVTFDPTSPTAFSLESDWTRSESDEGGQVDVLFPGRQVAYARFAYKQDATFDDSGIKKLLRFRGHGYGNLLGTLDIDDDEFVWFYDKLDDSQVRRQNMGSMIRPSALRGSWHWIEALNDISQDGALRFQVWVDGQEIMHYTIPANNRGWTFAMASFGGTFNAPAATATDWITDVAASTDCIGSPWK